MSRSINKAIIVGNLTRDPELKYTPNGKAVTTFGVATNRRWTANGEQKEEVEFHNVTAWGKLAEICSQLLAKGRKVYVEGRLRTRNWEDQNGVKHYRTEIVALDMVVLSPRLPAQAGGAAPEGETRVVPVEAKAEAPLEDANAKTGAKDKAEDSKDGKKKEKKESAGSAKGSKSKKAEDIDPEVIPF